MRKGKVVDRKKIMRHLWQDESFVDENTLTVNIVRLRKNWPASARKTGLLPRKGKVIWSHEFHSIHKGQTLFLMLYAGMMGFISIIMTLSFNPALVSGNLLYIHIVCFALVTAYLLIGYYYRRSYYRKLQQLIHLDREDWPVVAPEPQNLQQRLYLELFTKLHRQHERDLRKLNEEKIDHQEFILSWIHEVKLPIAASRLLMENSTGKQPIPLPINLRMSSTKLKIMWSKHYTILELIPSPKITSSRKNH